MSNEERPALDISVFDHRLATAGGGSASGAASPATTPAAPRILRHRTAQRSDSCRGEAVTIELRDARLIKATLVDESLSGLALNVADLLSFCPTQRIAIRRRGQRHPAVVRYVQAEAADGRLGVKFCP